MTSEHRIEFLERQGLVELPEQKDTATFVVASTPQQWRAKGRVFLSVELYELAAQCYDNGQAPADADMCRGLHFQRLARDRQTVAGASDEPSAHYPAVQRYAAVAARHLLAALTSSQPAKLCYAGDAADCLKTAGQTELAAQLQLRNV